MIVRNLFDRMFSSYRDKLERNKTWYHQHHGDQFEKKTPTTGHKSLGQRFL